MPFLIALAGIVVTAFFWAHRARNAAHIVSDLADMAGDVRLAARRFGFARKANVHPVESIDSPDLAAAGLACAFVALDDMPTSDQTERLRIQLRRVLRVDDATSRELMILGNWLVSQCQGPQPAIARLSRKLYRLEGSSALDPIMDILTGTLYADTAPSLRQSEALEELKTAFRVR